MLFNRIKGPIFSLHHAGVSRKKRWDWSIRKLLIHSKQTDKSSEYELLFVGSARPILLTSVKRCFHIPGLKAHLCFVYRAHPLFYLVLRPWRNMSSLSVIGTRHRIAHWTPWTGNFASFLVLQHHTDWKTRVTQHGKLLLSRTVICIIGILHLLSPLIDHTTKTLSTRRHPPLCITNRLLCRVEWTMRGREVMTFSCSTIYIDHFLHHSLGGELGEHTSFKA